MEVPHPCHHLNCNHNFMKIGGSTSRTHALFFDIVDAPTTDGADAICY